MRTAAIGRRLRAGVLKIWIDIDLRAGHIVGVIACRGAFLATPAADITPIKFFLIFWILMAALGDSRFPAFFTRAHQTRQSGMANRIILMTSSCDEFFSKPAGLFSFCRVGTDKAFNVVRIKNPFSPLCIL